MCFPLEKQLEISNNLERASWPFNLLRIVPFIGNWPVYVTEMGT